METDPDSWGFALSAFPLFITLPPQELVFGLVAVILLLLGSALISGSEVAFFSFTPNDLDRLSQDSNASSRRILWLRERPRKLLATILISNNFINIAIVLLLEYVFSLLLPSQLLLDWATGITSLLGRDVENISALADGISFTITIVGATFLLVLFGEVAPKVYARFNSIKLAQLMSGPLGVLMQVFNPISMVLVNLTRLIERRLRRTAHGGQEVSREDIDDAIELTVSTEDDTDQEVDILRRILKFPDLTVKQVMRSRMDVVSVESRSSYGELMQIVRESGYSRVPVTKEDFDQVIGILYVKDLLGHLHEDENFRWQRLVRDNVLFVPEAKKIRDLLREFQHERMHMAIVVDEYGGGAGVVTLEDVLEEVIGDIQDEFDDEPEVIYHKIDDYNYRFDGKSLLNDVCRIVGIDTDTFDEVKGEADSVAGLLLEMLGEMPQEKQIVLYEDYTFKILSVNERRISEICITLPQREENV